MNKQRAAWLLAAATALACGEKASITSNQDPPAPAAPTAPPSTPPPSLTRATVTPAWTTGSAPSGISGGPRASDPGQPLPTTPSAIAAGQGRVLVATQDACIELLDLATGKPLVPRLCEKDRFPTGIAILGDTAVVARRDDIRGYDPANLTERWRTDVGIIQTQWLLQPRPIADRFCAAVFRPGKGNAVVCLDPATGKPTADIPLREGSRVALGDQLIGIIDADTAPVAPTPAGQERPVRFLHPDGKPAARSLLRGVNGPSFEQASPIFLVRGGGHDAMGGWITRYVAPTGQILATITGKQILSEGGATRRGQAVTTEYSAVRRGATAAAFDAAGTAVWRTDLTIRGPIRPWIVEVAGHIHLGHDRGIIVLDPITGAITRTYPVAATTPAIVGDRVLMMVEARATRTDSDYGDAGVHAIDAATGDVLLHEDLGRDLPGGQQHQQPVVSGDMVVLVAAGRVRAYRVSM
ncbi:MAG TPA: PQQ-binding-like beta-propeller repeat protein [Kofleriaceae bacterium]|nr:PQQ-binding-like beta-propeller repeat protein [Kofleriaceae bacterium]